MTPNGVKEMELVPVDEHKPAVAPPSPVEMFERLARDPSVDVEKLERLIAMQERIMRHTAKAEFDAAFAQMQGQIPVITEDGKILVNGSLRSRYATNEAIQETVKPILQEYGFSLRFRNEHMDGNRLKVIGILSHRGGHSEQDEFICPPDTSGAKNDIQAIGSTRHYGQRYTTCALLNVATRGADDDGKASGQKEKPAPPVGFQTWWEGMNDVVPEGLVRYAALWKAAKPEYRAYVNDHLREVHEMRKAAAELKDKQKAGAK
jgi:hypothetical protein